MGIFLYKLRLFDCLVTVVFALHANCIFANQMCLSISIIIWFAADLRYAK